MSIDSNQVSRLLVELGERNPRIERIVQEADAPRWAIELVDGIIVFAELNQERGRLNLQTDLGRPPEDHRLATCEALMMLTSLEHASHDWATALSEPDGEFQLCGHVAVSEPGSIDLQSTLIAFADRAQQWQHIVAQGARLNAAANEIFLSSLLV